jgi:hypothetical protein
VSSIPPDTKNQLYNRLAKELYNKSILNFINELASIKGTDRKLTDIKTKRAYCLPQYLGLRYEALTLFLCISLDVRINSYRVSVLELEKERNMVEGYIRQVLNLSDHVDDYKTLLPDSLHQTIDTFKSTFSNNSDLRINENLKEIALNKNKKYIQLMKERMLKNLLDYS